jgi:hypothetical protein
MIEEADCGKGQVISNKRFTMMEQREEVKKRRKIWHQKYNDAN